MHKACNSDLNFYVYNRGNLTLTHTYKRAAVMLQNVDTPTRTLAILNLKVCFSHSSLDICCLYRLKRVNSLLQLVSTALVARVCVCVYRMQVQHCCPFVLHIIVAAHTRVCCHPKCCKYLAMRSVSYCCFIVLLFAYYQHVTQLRIVQRFTYPL